MDNKYDKVYLVYNKFKNAATQIVEFEQFLPLIPKAEKNIDKKDYIFEPEINKVLYSLLFIITNFVLINFLLNVF